jgi:hypothetical protein
MQDNSYQPLQHVGDDKADEAAERPDKYHGDEARDILLQIGRRQHKEVDSLLLCLQIGEDEARLKEQAAHHHSHRRAQGIGQIQTVRIVHSSHLVSCEMNDHQE